MDMILFVIFFIIGFLLFFIGLEDERSDKKNDDETSRSNHFILLCFLWSTVFIILSGVCLMSTTETYYSTVTDTLEETYNSLYFFVGIGISLGFGSFNILLLLLKFFEILEDRFKGE